MRGEDHYGGLFTPLVPGPYGEKTYQTQERSTDAGTDDDSDGGRGGGGGGGRWGRHGCRGCLHHRRDGGLSSDGISPHRHGHGDCRHCSRALESVRDSCRIRIDHRDGVGNGGISGSQ